MNQSYRNISLNILVELVRQAKKIFLYPHILHFMTVDCVIFQLILTQQGWTTSLLRLILCVIETFNIHI